MKLLTILIATTSIFHLSCSSRFTPEQQAKLTTLRVSTPTYDQEGAYRIPTGETEKSDVIATAGAGGGFVGALLGQLVVEGISAGQRSGFKKKYGNSIANAKSSIPSDLTGIMKSKNEAVINSLPQLNGKINNSSANNLTTEITSYGYKRIAKVGSSILMSPYIYGTVTLEISGEKAVKPMMITAEGKTGNEITAYISNKSLAKSAFTKVSEVFAENVKTEIQKKFR